MLSTNTYTYPLRKNESKNYRSSSILLSCLKTGRRLYIFETRKGEKGYSVIGGKKELVDKSSQETAKREYKEETGEDFSFPFQYTMWCAPSKSIVHIVYIAEETPPPKGCAWLSDENPLLFNYVRMTLKELQRSLRRGSCVSYI